MQGVTRLCDSRKLTARPARLCAYDSTHSTLAKRLQQHRNTPTNAQAAHSGPPRSLALLLQQLALVELQLPALQDIAVAPPALPRPRGDARQQPPARKLRVQRLRARTGAASVLAQLRRPFACFSLLCHQVNVASWHQRTPTAWQVGQLADGRGRATLTKGLYAGSAIDTSPHAAALSCLRARTSSSFRLWLRCFNFRFTWLDCDTGSSFFSSFFSPCAPHALTITSCALNHAGPE